MMEIAVKYLDFLIDELANKYNVARDRKGLETICEKVPGVTSEYLYKKIANRISKLRVTDKIRLRESLLRLLLADLEFRNVNEFMQFVDVPLCVQARSLVGTYYTYVRRNTAEGVLLRSPICIVEQGRKLVFTLMGERLMYTGDVVLKNGVVYILMKSSEGKCFHHIYKIGTMESPKVMQGIFSGVTSSFEPIGGRVVLERRDEEFKKLKLGSLDISEMKKSRLKNQKQLAKYFEKYTNNNLRIGKVTSFSFGDLD